jgi:hypothetical protein
MKDRLEGVQHLRVLGINEGRGGADDVGRGVVLSWNQTTAALVSAMSTRVDESRRDDGGGQGGCDVLGLNGGGADVREDDECRRWEDGGGRG